ncbi:hypothetical protein [Streptomyces nigrescens]|uniref:hypothetical protein n=1 Tax=Streptomyces nigrescens TaxID=1920 RepID=UPI0034949ADF
MLYLTAAGSVAVQGEPLVAGMADVPPFDRQTLITALRSDQAGRTTFPEFVQGDRSRSCHGDVLSCSDRAPLGQDASCPREFRPRDQPRLAG